MRIENLRAETNENKTRVTATVIWEDCERPATEVYFATDKAFAEDLSCDPHAFLTACIMPALHHGEKRVFVDGEICPVLRDGLMTAMSWMRHWYDSPERELVRIEAKTRSNYPTPRTPERAGLFFSGGIDSLAALRTNRLNYPVTHPGSIKDCLLLYGQNIESDNRLETFEQAARSLGEVARDAGAMLIPVYTNVRSLEDDTTFFLHKFQAAILAAVAHAFTPRLSVATLASDIHHCHSSWGTHPLLDPNYSSGILRIQHDSTVLSRLERTRLVAGWDAALQNIKVCPPNWPGLNCGRCEKCLRTRLSLLVLGVLDQTEAFPPDEITTEMVKSTVKINTSYYARFYGELIAPLKEVRRPDLARILEEKIARYYDREPGWKGRIKRFDRKYLHGRLIRFKKAVYH